MNKNPLWKLFLIAGIAALCGLSIWYFGLRPGLDLVGGTTLTYEVAVPETMNVSTAIEQTIQTLQQRVDPAGVRNLVWRRQGGNRIEIQMPAPPKETGERRAHFLKLRDALFAHNIERSRIDVALRLPAETRGQGLAALATDSAPMQARLKELTDAYDALVKGRGPYDQMQQQLDAVEKAIHDAGEMPDAEKQQMLARRKALVADIEEPTRAYLEAKGRYEKAYDAVLADNVTPAELQRVVDLPTSGQDPENPKKRINPRQLVLESLLEQHPDRKAQLQEVADAYAGYERVKGPLDDPTDLIAMLRGAGVLEFRIAPRFGALPDENDYRQQLEEKGPTAGPTRPYRWLPVDKPENFAEGKNSRVTRANIVAMNADARGFFAGRGLIAQAYGDAIYMLLANTPGASMTPAQEGWQLTAANQIPDDRGLPAVGFSLNVVGAQLMGQLTGNHLQQPMAIVLDGRVMSAPNINDKISGNGIITGGQGGFSPQELEYLTRTLRAGALQAKLSDYPISIQQIGATFGEDNLKSGLQALVWSLIVVCVFMLAYYFFWGSVANVSLILNMLIVLGVMSFLNATFTLPGIAGLVLAIGMAVDANVLIYERIREELERKADLPTAVRLGFDKALSTIIDANLTTVITCWVLYGCPPFDKVVDVFKTPADVKGFAVTLGLGVMVNIFTGVFCTRAVIDCYLYFFRPKALTMLAMVSHPVRKLLSPNIDWLGKKWIFISISSVLFVGGIVAIVSRGEDFLDIEFRGGTQVTFKLAQGKALTLQDARQRLDNIARKHGMPELAGDRAVVVSVGGLADNQATAFSISTLNTHNKEVSEKVKEAFGDVLDTTVPLHFAGMGDMEKEAAEGAPAAQAILERRVVPVTGPQLGVSIGRPGVTTDVSKYVGGVAIVVRDLDPAASVADITQRVKTMRDQPTYEKLGFRESQVIGLDQATNEQGAPLHDAAGQPLFRSVVVVTDDGATNYVDSPETFAGNREGLAQTEWALVRDALLRDTSLGSVSNFSPQVSATMTRQAIFAVVLSWLAIMAYVWLRFGDLRYGLGAIIALIHDVVIAVGLAAATVYVADTALGRALMLEPFHLNLAMIAAALTLIGFSVNDTIVIFDRIRENRGKLAFASKQVINDSINQTISRTILTTGTLFIAVMLLYILGGPGVHAFAFVMLVGCVVGTYSSLAIAAPILLLGVETPTPKATGTPAVAGLGKR
ncbi:MAG: protein translocase subunit SecD [Phycisphaeraceae bacterium]